MVFSRFGSDKQKLKRDINNLELEYQEWTTLDHGTSLGL